MLSEISLILAIGFAFFSCYCIYNGNRACYIFEVIFSIVLFLISLYLGLTFLTYVWLVCIVTSAILLLIDCLQNRGVSVRR